MELEQRVKVLEQEMKILKNQIQTTLLDIQEQLLVGKYPALRAGDENGVSPAEPAGESEPSAASAEVPAPIIRKVILSDTPAPDLPQFDERPDVAVPLDIDALPSQNGNDWNNLVHMNDWAIATVDRVGVERAQALIMMYARRGMLTPDVEEALLEAVEAYAPRNGSAPAAEYPAEETPLEEDAPQGVVDGFSPDEYLEEPKAERNLIVRLIKGLQNGGHEVNRG